MAYVFKRGTFLLISLVSVLSLTTIRPLARWVSRVMTRLNVRYDHSANPRCLRSRKERVQFDKVRV